MRRRPPRPTLFPYTTRFRSFLWGGVLGTVVAGTLEYDVARALGFLPKLAIGLIEESAKLLVPLVFYFLGRHRSEADRKSTRLNSSHANISYAVFCLKKNNTS